jgi:hypothetical protein
MIVFPPAQQPTFCIYVDGILVILAKILVEPYLDLYAVVEHFEKSTINNFIFFHLKTFNS